MTTNRQIERNYRKRKDAEFFAANRCGACSEGEKYGNWANISQRHVCAQSYSGPDAGDGGSLEDMVRFTKASLMPREWQAYRERSTGALRDVVEKIDRERSDSLINHGYGIVHCPWLESMGGDPETFARVVGDQWFCNACGSTDHERVPR